MIVPTVTDAQSRLTREHLAQKYVVNQYVHFRIIQQENYLHIIYLQIRIQIQMY